MLIFDQLKKGDPQLRLLATVVIGGLLLLLAGLWWVQIVSARDYQSHLETQSFRTVRIPAARGKILDRNGQVLAENSPSYSINLYLEDLSELFRKEYKRLAPVHTVTNSFATLRSWFGLSPVTTRNVRLKPDQIEALEWQARYRVTSNVVMQISQRLQQPLALSEADFQRHYQKRLFTPYPVLTKLNASQVARFEEQFTGTVGSDLEVLPTRLYPHETTASHVLGYLQRDDSSVEGEEAFFSYRLPDYRGMVGIEGGFDQQLRGRAGEKSVLVNNLGYRQTESFWNTAEPGHNIVLTLDLQIQQAAERAMARHVGALARGAVVVMDVRSGDILALVSSPTLNPNHFIQGFPAGEHERLNDPLLRPQINRATQENYAPGSIFKTLVGLACLEAGLNPDETIYNPGYIYVGRRHIKDLAAPGPYNFRLAIMHSSNTYFVTNGLRAGIHNVIRLGRQLHLGERTGLPTRQETGGKFPSLQRVGSGWSDGDTANICIGQGEISVTPMQMAILAAAIANGGKVLWPRLVDRLEPQEDPTSTGKPVVFESGRVRDELDVRPDNLNILRKAMLDEVEEGGTGTRAAVTGMRICGKTGTAQIMDEHNRLTGDTTWFISFAPYETPRYAVVVMVERGVSEGSGGLTCAPIASDIYSAIQRYEGAAGAKSLATAN